MTAPISASLTRPLAKLTSACLENSRLKPASGEIFESFGLSASADHTRRCWIMLPAIAASTSSSSGIAMRGDHLDADLAGTAASKPRPSTAD